MSITDAAVPAAPFPGGPAFPFAGADVCAAAGLGIRPGGQTVMFDDDQWQFADVEALPVQMRACITRLDFTAITDPRWRLVAKEYLFARLAPAHPQVAVLPRAYRVPLTLWTCSRRLAELRNWLNWLTGQQVRSLGELTQEYCDRYLNWRRLRRDRDGTETGTVEESVTRVAAAVIAELAEYGELFTADRYPPGFIPWDGRTSSQVAGMRPPAENKTPVVEQRILQPMLAAALYLAGTVGPHVAALQQEIADHRRQLPRLTEAQPSLGDLERVIRRHTATGTPFEAARDVDVRTRLVRGWDPADPLLHLSSGALAREAGTGRLRPGLLAAARSLLIEAAGRAGIQKPWARQAALIPRADGGGGIAWTLPLDEREVRDLTGYVHTACLLVTAGLTGMRASEKRAELRSMQHSAHRIIRESAGQSERARDGRFVIRGSA